MDPIHEKSAKPVPKAPSRSKATFRPERERNRLVHDPRRVRKFETPMPGAGGRVHHGDNTKSTQPALRLEQGACLCGSPCELGLPGCTE